MKRMNASERQNQIVDLLSQNGVMKIMDIADHFNVSRETIRRDLITLEDDNRIKKWFGGVISVNENQDFNIQSLEQKIELNTDVKMEICKKALEFIPPQSDIRVQASLTVRSHPKYVLSYRTGCPFLSMTDADASGSLPQ